MLYVVGLVHQAWSSMLGTSGTSGGAATVFPKSMARLSYSQVKRSQHAVAQYLPSVPCLSQSYIDRKLCFCARRVRCLILRGILVSWVKLTSVEQFVVEKVRSSLY